MAKANSPIRLQADLMERAALAGEISNRSTAQQVEFWASIGQSVADVMTATDVLDFKAGLITIEPKKQRAEAIDPKALLSEIETAQENGTLSDAITSGGPRYQMSQDYPGHLEQVLPDGTVSTGYFSNGVFINELSKER